MAKKAAKISGEQEVSSTRMTIKISHDILFTALVVIILGCGLLFMLPRYEKAENYVKFTENAQIQVTKASEDAAKSFNTTAEITIPVSWSAPWAGSCYLAVDVRPEGAEKGEPETPQWDSNHLIRANYNGGQWWVQKWINIYVLEQRKGNAGLIYAIADPKTSKLDVYVELKCDDKLLDQVSTKVDYKI